MEEENLWHQFNLDENNPDVAGPIIYAAKYSAERISAQREQVITALIDLEVTISETEPEVLRLDINSSPQERLPSIYALIEELSTLNEALLNIKADPRIEGQGINRYLNTKQIDLFQGRNNREKVDTYDDACIHTPDLLMRLLVAHKKNNCFSKTTLRLIDDCNSIGAQTARMLGGGRYVVMGTGQRI